MYILPFAFEIWYYFLLGRLLVRRTRAVMKRRQLYSKSITRASRQTFLGKMSSMLRSSAGHVRASTALSMWRWLLPKYQEQELTVLSSKVSSSIIHMRYKPSSCAIQYPVDIVAWYDYAWSFELKIRIAWSSLNSAILPTLFLINLANFLKNIRRYALSQPTSKFIFILG